MRFVKLSVFSLGLILAMYYVFCALLFIINAVVQMLPFVLK